MWAGHAGEALSLSFMGGVGLWTQGEYWIVRICFETNQIEIGVHIPSLKKELINISELGIT